MATHLQLTDIGREREEKIEGRGGQAGMEREREGLGEEGER